MQTAADMLCGCCALSAEVDGNLSKSGEWQRVHPAWGQGIRYTFRAQLDFLSVCSIPSKDLTRMSNPARICPDGR